MCKPCSPFNYQTTIAKDSEFLGTLSNVDSLIHEFMDTNQVKGCAVAIVCGNKISYLKGYGLSRDENSNQDFNYYTPSSVGSVSKTLTALGVLNLYERGFLELDDTVSQHLPFSPPAWQGITIGALLSHRSGLERGPSFNYPETEDDLIAKFPEGGDHPGIHPRYAYWSYRSSEITEDPNDVNYSNTGYSILGAIIDFITTNDGNDFKAVERGYENFIWWNVGMKGGIITGDTMQTPCLNTHWRRNSIPNIAFDYPEDDLSLDSQQFTGWEGPAGGWSMSIGDLARLMILINTNKIISQETKDIMMVDYGSFGSSETGMGVFRPNAVSRGDEYFGREAFFHSGLIGNYESRYTMWPESGFGVALMVNSRVGGASLKSLTLAIAGLRFTGSPLHSVCAINDFTFSPSDSEVINSQLYFFLKNHKRDMLNILELYQYRYGNLEKGFSEMLKGVDKNGEKKFQKLLRDGEFEKIARMANVIFKKIVQKPDGRPSSLPIPEEEKNCC